MAKKIEGYIKLQIPAGKANPAPPIGPALGQHGPRRRSHRADDRRPIVHKTIEVVPDADRHGDGDALGLGFPLGRQWFRLYRSGRR